MFYIIQHENHFSAEMNKIFSSNEKNNSRNVVVSKHFRVQIKMENNHFKKNNLVRLGYVTLGYARLE